MMPPTRYKIATRPPQGSAGHRNHGRCPPKLHLDHRRSMATRFPWHSTSSRPPALSRLSHVPEASLLVPLAPCPRRPLRRSSLTSKESMSMVNAILDLHARNHLPIVARHWKQSSRRDSGLSVMWLTSGREGRTCGDHPVTAQFPFAANG